HYTNERDGNSQPDAPRGLLMDQCPITGTSLCVLRSLGRIVEGELDVMKGAQFIIAKHGSTVAIRGDRELYRFSPEVSQNLAELRMHSVLAGAQIHRAHR